MAAAPAAAATSWPFIWNFTFYSTPAECGRPLVSQIEMRATATAAATSNYKRCTHSNPRPFGLQTHPHTHTHTPKPQTQSVSNSNLWQQFLTVAIALATVPPVFGGVACHGHMAAIAAHKVRFVVAAAAGFMCAICGYKSQIHERLRLATSMRQIAAATIATAAAAATAATSAATATVTEFSF